MPSNLTRKELRDYYAAEAMNGLVAGMPERFVKNAKDFAQRAFDIADAMLEESDRRGVLAGGETIFAGHNRRCRIGYGSDALLRQRQMEGKRQQTAAAMAGMSERSAEVACGPLPSETKQERRWRTRPDPFDGVWEEEILPLLQPAAGSGHPWKFQRLPACAQDRRSTVQEVYFPQEHPPAGTYFTGGNHRRPALELVLSHSGWLPGGCRRDLCGPEAGAAERALGTGRRAPGHTLRQQLGPHP